MRVITILLRRNLINRRVRFVSTGHQGTAGRVWHGVIPSHRHRDLSQPVAGGLDLLSARSPISGVALKRSGYTRCRLESRRGVTYVTDR